MSVEGEKGEVDSEEMGEMSLPGIRGSVSQGERGPQQEVLPAYVFLRITGHKAGK